MAGILEDIQKGIITPQEVSYSGNLTPKVSRNMLNAIIKNQPFLSTINSGIIGKLTQDLWVYNSSGRVIVRHKSGISPTEDQYKKLSKHVCNINASNGVSLNVKIGDDTLEEAQDNPNFIAEQTKEWNTLFGNDLEDLAFNGIADNTAQDAPFEELAVGFLHLAKNKTGTLKETTTATTVIDKLKYVVSKIPKSLKGRVPIILSPADLEAYNIEFADGLKNANAMLSADNKTFLGYKLIANDFMPIGTFLVTPLQNLIFRVSSQVKKQSWYENKESALHFKYVLFPDFEIGIASLCLIVESA
jgi:hypothetical protein